MQGAGCNLNCISEYTMQYKLLFERSQVLSLSLTYREIKSVAYIPINRMNQ